MANNVVQPGQMQEPGELLDPEKGSRFEQYKVDGVYEYGIKNGKKDKSRVRVSISRFLSASLYAWIRTVFLDIPVRGK